MVTEPTTIGHLQRSLSICLVTGEFPPMQGGVGDYTRELARSYVRQGHRVTVVTSTRGTWSEPGITVYPVVDDWGFGCWGRIMDACRETSADILHIQYQTAAFGMHPAVNLLPLRLRSMKTRPRTVFTYHDLRVPYLFPKAGPLRRWVTEGPAGWCDAAIVTNCEDATHLKAAGKSFHIIPIGSNISTALPAGYDRAAWRAKLGVQLNETLLCYFGFLNESKGGETLIQALWELSTQNRLVKLVMVGGQVGDSDPTNAAYLQRIKGMIEKLRLGDHVLWTGFTSDEEVSAHFGAADVAVLPYRDGASFRRGSFMAALSHGLPIVTTKGKVTVTAADLSGVTDDVDLPTLVDADNVLLVPPDDAAAVARAVIRLIANPALRQRLATRARLLADAFSWDEIARRSIDVYRSIVPR